MTIGNNELIIIFSSIIILSYFFNFIASKVKVPSVLLLLFLGISLKLLANYSETVFNFSHNSLELLGTFGLILIVLEATLDLKLKRENMPTIRNAFLASLIILFVSAFSIAAIIQLWLDTSIKKAIINAIPMAVISSAIAIPSVVGLPKRIREFIVYEATFSDIAGIMLFYYVIQDKLLTLGTFGIFTIKFISIIIISLAGSLLLLFLINRITSHVKFFLILSVLLLIYASGKIFHLPSLLLVLVFGLLVSNSEKFIKGKLRHLFNPEKLQSDITPFKTITEESAFMIRTFFFVLFGYSINLEELFSVNIIFGGLAIVSTSLLIRYLYLKVAVKEADRTAKLFLAPRGLITVILFYSIPKKYIIPEFSVGIVFFVIIISGLMMGISLRKGYTEKEQKVQDITKEELGSAFKS
jgi:NhaP-type Na+/H+ or K+/H+ antiporter